MMSSPQPLHDEPDSMFGPVTARLGRAHAAVRIAAVSLLLLLTGLTGGMVLERHVLQGGAGGGSAFADLEAAAKVIDENYYYLPTDPDERAELADDMEEQAITGALSALDDTYTRYLPPDESATASEDLEGRYGGIGVDLAFGEDIVMVANVVPDSPADDAGIQRGDVVEKIGGQSLVGEDPNEIIRMLRGEIGASVSVTLIRPATGDLLSLDLVLEEIVVPPVTLRMVEGTSIAWLRITLFGDQTVAEVDEALALIEQEGATGIILDLRGNGGGWVDSARATLGRFLDPALGPAMFEDVTPGPGGMEPLDIIAGEETGQTNLPMIVLVDGGTASSAEIVAGSLRDYDRAMIVGQPTFGKGSVQRIFRFSDGSTIRVTVAEWFTPSRGRIQDAGIQPDLEISAAGHGTPEDPVIGTAVRLLESGQSRPSDLVSPATPVATPATPASS